MFDQCESHNARSWNDMCHPHTALLLQEKMKMFDQCESHNALSWNDMSYPHTALLLQEKVNCAESSTICTKKTQSILFQNSSFSKK